MFNEDWKREFLSRTGWADADESHAGDDWALRRFSRLSRVRDTRVLMQSLPDDHPRATLGHKVADYVRIATYLKKIDFPTPVIFEAETDRGLLLIEDFGDTSLHEIIAAGSPDAESYYIQATKLLWRIYTDIKSGDIDLPNFFDTAIYKGRRRLVDWYYPAVSGAPVSDRLIDDYLSAWQEIDASLPAPVLKFSHADYHPHNLMIRNGDIGLIDFQGAMWAPGPYDLVNLLEDARRVVPGHIKHACLKIFEDNLPPSEWTNFQRWYQVLACQFHCRVIGQAVRLAVRENKTRLLDYIPNLKKYLATELQSPVLEPLARFFDEADFNFSASTGLNLSPDLYRADAF